MIYFSGRVLDQRISCTTVDSHAPLLSGWTYFPPYLKPLPTLPNYSSAAHTISPPQLPDPTHSGQAMFMDGFMHHINSSRAFKFIPPPGMMMHRPQFQQHYNSYKIGGNIPPSSPTQLSTGSSGYSDTMSPPFHKLNLESPSPQPHPQPQPQPQPQQASQLLSTAGMQLPSIKEELPWSQEYVEGRMVEVEGRMIYCYSQVASSTYIHGKEPSGRGGGAGGRAGGGFFYYIKKVQIRLSMLLGIKILNLIDVAKGCVELTFMAYKEVNIIYVSG